MQPQGVRAQSRSGHQQGGVLETPPGSPPPFPFCLALPCHRATTLPQARVSQSPPQAQCSGSPGAAHRVPGHHDQASPSLVALGGSTQGRPGRHISKQLRDSVIRGNAQTLEASPGDTPAVPGNPTAAQMGRGLWTRAETIVGCGLNKQKVIAVNVRGPVTACHVARNLSRQGTKGPPPRALDMCPRCRQASRSRPSLTMSLLLLAVGLTLLSSTQARHWGPQDPNFNETLVVGRGRRAWEAAAAGGSGHGDRTSLHQWPPLLPRSAATGSRQRWPRTNRSS